MPGLWSRAACSCLAALGIGLSAQSLQNIGVGGASAPNSIASAAPPGSLVRLTLPGGTGTPQLRIGSTKVSVVDRRRHDGALHLTFRIPPRTPEGCYVPLHLTSSGTVLPDSIPVAVSTTPACKPPPYQFSDAWIAGRTGIVARIHTTELSPETGGQLSTVDIVSAFFDGNSTTLLPGPLLRFPPAGLCATRSGSYVRATPTIDILVPLLLADVGGVELDAGGFLHLDDGRYQMRIPLVIGRSAMFWKTVASSQEQFQSLSTKGNLNIRVPGGRDIQPFTATLPLPPAFDWIDPPPTPLLHTGKDATVSWKAAAPGIVLVAAIAVNADTARFSYCLCLADASASRYALPGRLLGPLVEATGAAREAAGMLYLIHVPEAVHPFHSQQLETTAGFSLQILATKVLFRR